MGDDLALPTEDPNHSYLCGRVFVPVLDAPYPAHQNLTRHTRETTERPSLLFGTKQRLAEVVGLHRENVLHRVQESLRGLAEASRSQQQSDDDWYERAAQWVRKGYSHPEESAFGDITRFGDGYYATESSVSGSARLELGAALWERMKADQPGFNMEDWKRSEPPVPERIGPVADSRNYLIGSEYTEPFDPPQHEDRRHQVSMKEKIDRLRYGATRDIRRQTEHGNGDAELGWIHETS